MNKKLKIKTVVKFKLHCALAVFFLHDDAKKSSVRPSVRPSVECPSVCDVGGL